MMLSDTLLAAVFLSALFVRLPVARALDNGVARLPVLGYNTWNAYACNINDSVILETATLMKSLGLQDAGYVHVNLDDCWAEKNRSAEGLLVPNQTRFPNGFNNLTAQLHDMGFQAGIYGDSGWETCAGYAGSWGNELLDAGTFQGWGFDYLKYDNCYIPFDGVTRQGTYGKYQRMADAIAELAASSGKPPIIFSLCEWGWSQVWIWGSTVGNSWRGRILLCLIDFRTQPESSLTVTSKPTGPQSRVSSTLLPLSLDIRTSMGTTIWTLRPQLEVGNGNMTYDENKSHFTAWALMKSPLLIGTDLSVATHDIVEILSNKEILAISQDPVGGMSISPFRWGTNPDWTSNSSYPAQYWSGPTQNGTVVMLLNTLSEPANMFFNLTESPWIRAGRQYAVRDLWTHTDNGTAIRSFTATSIPPHGVVALLLQDAGDEPDGILPLCVVYTQCAAQNGTLVDGS